MCRRFDSGAAHSNSLHIFTAEDFGCPLPTRLAVIRGGVINPSSTAARRGLDAFALVELLIVIGITAVLIGVLMGAIARAQTQAKRTVCLSNIRQLGTAILMYCDDNKGWLPTCAYPARAMVYTQYPDDWIHWQANRNLQESAIAKYISGGLSLRNLLLCPADNQEGREALPDWVPGQGPYLYSYGMNREMGVNVAPYWSWQPGERRITRWRVSSRKILLTESDEKHAPWPVCGYAVPLTRRHGTAKFHGSFPPRLTCGAKCGTNVSTAFLDGHAEPIDQDFAFDPSLFYPGGP